MVFFLLSQVGCSSSSSNNSKLIGLWLSNCYELKDASTGMFIAYTLDNLLVTEDSYIVTSIGYTDIACTVPNGDADSFVAAYTLGSQIDTTDGVEAMRLTLTSEIDLFGAITTIITESIYRITGVELNFGEFNPDNVPSLNYAITFIKQPQI